MSGFGLPNGAATTTTTMTTTTMPIRTTGRNRSMSTSSKLSSSTHHRTGSVLRSTGTERERDDDASTIVTSTTTTTNFETATSVAEIRAGLARLHERETATTRQLRRLASGQEQEDVQRELGRLDAVRATLGAQTIATRGIANGMLSGAAETAGRLSSTVRRLDLEKARVEATLAVVEQVAELKACVAGVVGSMGAPQDWEAAAGYLSRASRIPSAIVTSGFASAVVPTVEVPDPPAVTLEEARQGLCGLFLREFEKAAQTGDDARVTRFFKLFPLIGRTDVGLDVYGRYVCQGVASSARTVLKDTKTETPTFFYANALTKLFTHISQIVDVHGALVERHYGRGQMVQVIGRLQKEADVQGGILIDTWSDERGVDRRLTDVKSYPFSFLVQSFMAAQTGGVGGASSGSGSGTPRVNSPAFGNGSNNNNDSARPSEDEGGVNMKEVDGLLSEMAVMLSRWSLYTRFLSTKWQESEGGSSESRENNETRDNRENTTPLVLPPVLSQSNLQRKVAAKLVSPYHLLSTFFFRRSVEKAFQLEEMPPGLTLNLHKPLDRDAAPYILSAVDDVMYIANAVLQRALSTLQRDVVVGVLPPVGRVLGSDFLGMVQRKMRDEAYPRPVVAGGFPPEHRVVEFVVLVNSLDMADEYLARIVSKNMAGHLGGGDDEAENNNADDAQIIPPATSPAVVAHLSALFPFAHDVVAVAHALAGLYHAFATTAHELLHEALQVLFTQVVRARLRPVIADTFRDVDYRDDAVLPDPDSIEEDDFVVDVPRRFEQGWDALMKPLARLMTPRTYVRLADLAAQYLARVLEKRVWSFAASAPTRANSNSISAYGAIRLERDVNGIVAAVARGNYAAREQFAKTVQILMVANMEDDEWEELMAEEEDDEQDRDLAMVWLLSEDERTRARSIVRNG